MKIRHLLVILPLFLFISGCYFPISGRVVDAETNAPIEGAVVLVEWTKTIGYGLTYTESYKVAETLSDKDGKFALPGCYSPFVNPPDLAIYKKNYVTWSSRNIFPSWKNREDFQWATKNKYKLEKFKAAYSYTDHPMFTTGAINSTLEWEKKTTFIKAYDEGERDRVIKEQNEKDRKRAGGFRQ